ncbi:MAG: T9SS type A sorting domain-containing protein [Gracilimonas sp.]
MHKSYTQFKKAVVIGVALLIVSPVLLFGQVRVEGPKLLEIQQQYHRGEMDIETAALEQFRVLYEPEALQNGEKNIEKCATPAHSFLHRHRHELSEQTLNKIEAYQSENLSSKSTQAQQSYISPSGKFEVFYYTEGDSAVSLVDDDANGIPDYVDWVADAADSSYSHEVLNLGFTDPIPSDAVYRINIEDMGFYGETRPSLSEPAGTYFRLDNDFVGFPDNTDPAGQQKGALKVTVAHEFKHAIQFAQNQWTSPAGSLNWSEMDATLMEEVVYDDVNDYYHYIKTGLYSKNPNSYSIFYSPNSGTPGAYWHVSWMIFYSEAFGYDLLRDIWQLIEVENDLGIDEALVLALPNYGSDFATAFVQNHLWHYASGSRASDDDYGFSEKEFYPYSNVEASYSMVPVAEIDIESVNTLASRYYEVTPSENDYGPIDVAVDFDSTQVGLGLLFYLKSGETVELLATGTDKQQVYLPSTIHWEEIERLGIVVSNFSNNVKTKNLMLQFGKSGKLVDIRDPKYADLPENVTAFQNYPNPFNPTTNISFELSRTATVRLEVFDIMGRKIQTLANETLRLRSRPYVYEFNGNGLSSGMYIYRLRIDNEVYTKKMLLVK